MAVFPFQLDRPSFLSFLLSFSFLFLLPHPGALHMELAHLGIELVPTVVEAVLIPRSLGKPPCFFSFPLPITPSLFVAGESSLYSRVQEKVGPRTCVASQFPTLLKPLRSFRQWLKPVASMVWLSLVAPCV